MKPETLKTINAAKSEIKSAGYKVNSITLIDCYGDEEKYKPHSKLAVWAIKSAEEVCGIKRIFANFNNDIIVEIN
jgi:hypothetical protein